MGKTKVLIATLLSALLLVPSTSAFASTPADTYNFGGGAQAIDTQGTNGWYYVYSTEFNKGSNLDTTKLKQCKWGSDAMSSWFGPTWIPNETTVQGQPINFMRDVWTWFSDQGDVNPGINMTVGLQWVVPKDGEYSLTANYTGGSKDSGDKNDGVTFGIYQDTRNLISDTTPADLSFNGSYKNKTIELKKGESLSFTVDPNSDYANDQSTWNISLARVGDYTYNFGGGRQDITTQGANGWSYMYSTEFNKGNALDTNTFKNCVNGPDAMYAWTTGTGWVPNETTIQGQPIDLPSKYFNISSAGNVDPGMNVTPAVKWQAPEAGQYSVTAKYFGGSSQFDNNQDGITFGIYQGTKNLLSANSGNTLNTAFSNTYTGTLSLKNGESIFFTADPNGDYANDHGNWDVKMVKTGDYVDANLQPAKDAVAKAEGSVLQDDVDAARTLVALVESTTEKASLTARLDAVQAKISLSAATSKVTAAEASKLQADVDAANRLVSALPNGADKTALVERLAVVQSAINLPAAAAAVEKAEGSKLQADVDAASKLVTALHNGSDKTALVDRLAVVQSAINLSAAEEAVVKAEGSELQADVDAARALVKTLTAKDAEPLTARLAVVQKSIDAKSVSTPVVPRLPQTGSPIDTTILYFMGMLSLAGGSFLLLKKRV